MAVLADLSDWPEEQLHFHPSPESWSAAGVLDHVVKVEAGILNTMQAHLPEGHPVTMNDQLRARLLITIMRSPMRVKVPVAAQAVLPGAEQDISGLIRLWQVVRTDMIGLLENLGAANLRYGVFQHPVAGWMTVPTTLTFCAAHLQHHTYQINRLKRHTGNL